MDQIDLVEREKRVLLMKFMDTMVTVYAANGPTDEARELIKRLKSVYFVGYEEVEKQRTEKAARELEALSRKVFTVSAPRMKGGPATMTIT